MSHRPRQCIRLAPRQERSPLFVTRAFAGAPGKNQSYALATGPQAGSAFVLDVASSAVASQEAPDDVHVWSPAAGDVSVEQDPSADCFPTPRSARTATAASSSWKAPIRGPRGSGTEPRVRNRSSRSSVTSTPRSLRSSIGAPASRSRVTASSAPSSSRPGQHPRCGPWRKRSLGQRLGSHLRRLGHVGDRRGALRAVVRLGQRGVPRARPVVAASDTHVYFVAADGLCEIDGP
jgi:hypothetical protein